MTDRHSVIHLLPSQPGSSPTQDKDSSVSCAGLCFGLRPLRHVSDLCIPVGACQILPSSACSSNMAVPSSPKRCRPGPQTCPRGQRPPQPWQCPAPVSRCFLHLQPAAGLAVGCVSRSCPLCPYLASGANSLVLRHAFPATSPFTPGDPAAGTLVHIGPTTAPPQRSSCARIVGAFGHAFSPLALAGVDLQPHRSYCRTSVLRPNSASKVPGPRPCASQPSALSTFAGGLWPSYAVTAARPSLLFSRSFAVESPALLTMQPIGSYSQPLEHCVPKATPT